MEMQPPGTEIETLIIFHSLTMGILILIIFIAYLHLKTKELNADNIQKSDKTNMTTAPGHKDNDKLDNPKRKTTEGLNGIK